MSPEELEKGRAYREAVTAHVTAVVLARKEKEKREPGDKIAFASAPSLHTAAHEAAHVVQQRAGVSLSGGIGKEDDQYEKNADAIADRVFGKE